MATTALITGVSGFCGAHLARHICSLEAADVVGLDVAPCAPSGLPMAAYLNADLREYGEVVEAIRTAKPDWVFHLAGKTTGSAAELNASNVDASVNLLRALAEVR